MDIPLVGQNMDLIFSTSWLWFAVPVTLLVFGKDEQFPCSASYSNTSPLGQCSDDECHMMSCHRRDFLCALDSATKRLVVEKPRAHD
jgi:hypothetical protein